MMIIGERTKKILVHFEQFLFQHKNYYGEENKK